MIISATQANRFLKFLNGLVVLPLGEVVSAQFLMRFLLVRGETERLLEALVLAVVLPG